MIDKRIDFNAIVRSFGCNNCEHDVDGRADLCASCGPGDRVGAIPPNYRPRRGTIQEKVYYDRHSEVTYAEYERFSSPEK